MVYVVAAQTPLSENRILKAHKQSQSRTGALAGFRPYPTEVTRRKRRRRIALRLSYENDDDVVGWLGEGTLTFPGPTNPPQPTYPCSQEECKIPKDAKILHAFVTPKWALDSDALCLAGCISLCGRGAVLKLRGFGFLN